MELPTMMEDDHTETTLTDQLPGISKRRANKHLIERRRRARINSSLTQLKTLVLEGMKKDPTRFNRLEKADILEMTVTHLRAVRSRQVAASSSADPDSQLRYRAGFAECASEISRFLGGINDLDEKLKVNITDHLNSCMRRAEQTTGGALATSGYNPDRAIVPSMSRTSFDPNTPLDLSKNSLLADSDNSVDSQENISPETLFLRVPSTHAQPRDTLPLGQMQILSNSHLRVRCRSEGRSSPDSVSECSAGHSLSDHIDSGVDDVESLNEEESIQAHEHRKNELLHEALVNGNFPDGSMWRPW